MIIEREHHRYHIIDCKTISKIFIERTSISDIDEPFAHIKLEIPNDKTLICEIYQALDRYFEKVNYDG
jgi:hypothetical protein